MDFSAFREGEGATMNALGFKLLLDNGDNDDFITGSG